MSYSVKEIIGRRLSKTGLREYLVSWVGYPIEQSTWEPLRNLKYVKDMVKSFDIKQRLEKRRRKAVKKQASSDSEQECPKDQKEVTTKETSEPEVYVKIQNSADLEPVSEAQKQVGVGLENSVVEVEERVSVMSMCVNQRNEFSYLVKSSIGLISYKSRDYMIKNHPEAVVSFFERKVLSFDATQK